MTAMTTTMTKSAPKVGVHTEYAPIRGVIIHEPGIEWQLMPLESDMAESYLVEDILYLEKAAAEHRDFARCLRHIAGNDGVLEFGELLAEILDDTEVRSAVVGAVSALEGLGLRLHERLLSRDLNCADLAQILISGAAPAENGDRDLEDMRRYFRPIPNLMFTRDIGACVGASIILTHPAKRIRMRESLLAQYVFHNHSRFKGAQLIDILDDKPSAALEADVRLEGGDILVLDERTLIIGVGERTSEAGATLLMERALQDKLAEQVILVNIPTERATMHLDTVFTVIGPEECVYYPPLFESSSKSATQAVAHTFTLKNGAPHKSHSGSSTGLFDALEKIGYNFPNRIRCGGDSPLFQTREQWTDGANLFAAAPRVAFIYERNLETIRVFERAGYSIVTPSQFVELDPDTIDNTLITVSSGELSRGRGGARCMTLPFART